MMLKRSTLSQLLDYFDNNENKTISEICNVLGLKYRTVHQTLYRHQSRFNKKILQSGEIAYSSAEKCTSEINHHYIHKAFFSKELGLPL